MSSTCFGTECVRTHSSAYKADYIDAFITYRTIPVYTEWAKIMYTLHYILHTVYLLSAHLVQPSS
jgi:hypothetical protein